MENTNKELERLLAEFRTKVKDQLSTMGVVAEIVNAEFTLSVKKEGLHTADENNGGVVSRTAICKKNSQGQIECN